MDGGRPWPHQAPRGGQAHAAGSSRCGRPARVVQHGAGKHYPGEQTPRWALNATWRLDGQAVWDNGALHGRSRTGPHPATPMPGRRARLRAAPWPTAAGHVDADSRAASLRGPALLPDARSADAGQRRGRSRAIPRPAGARAHHPRVQPRAWTSRSPACCRCAGADGAGHASGKPNDGRCGRASCSWCPATASAGLRLPLNSLPWVDPTEAEDEPEPDPFEDRRAAAAKPRGPCLAKTGNGRPGLAAAYARR